MGAGSHKENKMKFRTRQDVFSIFCYLVAFAALVAPVFFLKQDWYFWAYIALALVCIVLTTVFTFNSYIELTDYGIKVFCGFASFEIGYDRILEVKQVKNIKLTAYAGTIKKLEVSYKSINPQKPYKMYIAPQKTEQFLKELDNRLKG